MSGHKGLTELPGKSKYQNIAILLDHITARGGTERAVTNLANIFAERGFNVHIISTITHGGGGTPYPLNGSVKVFHVGITSKDKWRLGWFKYIYRVRKYIRENNIQIAFAAGRQCSFMMYFFGSSIKRVVCEHFNYQSVVEHIRCGHLLNAIRKFIYPRLDALVCLTKGDSENYYPFMDRNKIFVIPNSLSFAQDKRSDLKTKRIIAVGYLNAQKNFPALIEAAAIMKPEIPDWHIDIFGSGKDRDKLLMLIREKALDDFVSIHNPVNDIKSEYLSSSIMAMSSIYEGLPMVLIEAEACGLPVVSFNCNYGPSDMIHDGVNGYLVDVGDIQGLAGKIVAVAKDETLRIKMGKASYENAKLYTPENIAAKWIELLNVV